MPRNNNRNRICWEEQAKFISSFQTPGRKPNFASRTVSFCGQLPYLLLHILRRFVAHAVRRGSARAHNNASFLGNDSGKDERTTFSVSHAPGYDICEYLFSPEHITYVSQQGSPTVAFLQHNPQF